MPNPGADRPIHKVTLNLYEEDYLALKQMFGHGWTTEVRNIIHQRLLDNRRTLSSYPTIRRTLGDLE